MAAYPIARAIKATLAKIGFRGPTSAKDEVSPVAIVGAKTISWSYKIKIKPAGFASAVRRRRRTKAGPFDAAEFFKSLSPPPRQLGDDEARVTEWRDPSRDWDKISNDKAPVAQRRDAPPDLDD
jgi:hypothetical protein